MTKGKQLSVREAALRLGCTRKYIFDLIYEKKLAGTEKIAKQWRIPAAAIERKIQTRNK
jgi:excisionase family DNA binding protein